MIISSVSVLLEESSLTFAANTIRIRPGDWYDVRLRREVQNASIWARITDLKQNLYIQLQPEV